MGLSFFFLFHISFSQADEISGYAVPSQIGGWYSGGGSSHDQGGGGDTVPSDPVLNCPSSATVGTSVSVTATSDYGVTFEYYWDDNALNPVYTGSTNGSVTDTRTFDSPGNRTFSTAASNGSYSSNWVSCSFPVDQPPQPPQPAPSVALTASPGTVTVGDTADLSWTSMNSTSCSASSNPGGVWSGGKGLSGNETSGALSSDTTFNITCSTSDGQQASASASVNAVAPTCGDPYATNYGGPLPCTYPPGGGPVSGSSCSITAVSNNPDGSVMAAFKANPTGGTPPYAYLWTDGGTAQTDQVTYPSTSSTSSGPSVTVKDSWAPQHSASISCPAVFAGLGQVNVYAGNTSADIATNHRKTLTVNQGNGFVVGWDTTGLANPSDYSCSANPVGQFPSWAGTSIAPNSTGSASLQTTQNIPVGTYTFSITCTGGPADPTESSSATLHMVSGSEHEI